MLVGTLPGLTVSRAIVVCHFGVLVPAKDVLIALYLRPWDPGRPSTLVRNSLAGNKCTAEYKKGRNQFRIPPVLKKEG